MFKKMINVSDISKKYIEYEAWCKNTLQAKAVLMNTYRRGLALATQADALSAGFIASLRLAPQAEGSKGSAAGFLEDGVCASHTKHIPAPPPRSRFAAVAKRRDRRHSGGHIQIEKIIVNIKTGYDLA
ncbi:MAG: hypothetical protein Pg6A_12180 [Termitinemataceae bacterium]|nr:MAG: hypothetical protein Pg6A_12180 [Termitinemataceae bacterium]